MDLETLYSYVWSGEIDKSLDFLFESIDTLLCQGKFTEVDEILSQVDFSRLESNTVIGFLSITSAAKHLLHNRVGFYDDCHKYFMKTHPERCERLLKGLR